jgi:hypothetical protein
MKGALAAKRRLMTIRWLPDEALGIPIKSGQSCKRGSIEKRDSAFGLIQPVSRPALEEPHRHSNGNVKRDQLR